MIVVHVCIMHLSVQSQGEGGGEGVGETPGRLTQMSLARTLKQGVQKGTVTHSV